MAGKGEAKLNDEVRTFVVQSLAMYDAPSVVVAAVKQEFGLVVTPQAVEFYDPTKRAGAKLHEKWKKIFTETRAAFVEETAGVGISHRVVRLRTLQRMVERTEKQGNLALAAQLLEQAAKEMGNAYTNKRELSGPGGSPIPVESKVDVSHLSPDQLRALASVRLPADS